MISPVNKSIVFILLLKIFLFFNFAFADDFIFVIDEGGKPLLGFRVLETTRDDVFLGKVEPLKKWIITPKSELYISKNGFLFPVKDSMLIDKQNGLVLYLVNTTDRKTLSFNIESIKIEKNIESLLKNRDKILAKVEVLFPKTKTEQIKSTETTIKEMDLRALAENYEKLGQINKAIMIYEEILNKQKTNEILNKLANLYYRIGDFKRAKYLYEKLPRTEDNLRKIVGILIIEKKFNEALRILDAQNFRDKGIFHYLRGIIYYLTDERDKAYGELVELKKIDKDLAESLKDLLR